MELHHSKHHQTCQLQPPHVIPSVERSPLTEYADVNGLNAATEQYQAAITANDVKKQIELQSLIKVGSTPFRSVAG
jgi:hypothetical protein